MGWGWLDSEIIMLVQQANWSWSAGLTELGQIEVKSFYSLFSTSMGEWLKELRIMLSSASSEDGAGLSLTIIGLISC